MVVFRPNLLLALLLPVACGHAGNSESKGDAGGASGEVGSATTTGTGTTGTGASTGAGDQTAVSAGGMPGTGGADSTTIGSSTVGGTTTDGSTSSGAAGSTAGTLGAGGASTAAGSGGASTTGGTGGTGGSSGGGFPADPEPIVLTDDGGWCWFESPRVLFHEGFLIAGSVASGHKDASRHGDIDAIVHNLGTSETTVVELHNQFELDDHDSPAFVVRPDGRLVTLYAKHGSEDHFYYRTTTSTSPLEWDATETFIPTSATRLTYQNLYLLPAENDRIYDFYRGLDDSYKPSYAYSDDLGESWTSGNIVINVPSTERHRPYVNYASNGVDTVHLVYTEAHPRDFDNSLYHVFYREGSLYRSDGTLIAPLTTGLSSPDQGTRIFQGDAQNVAWVANVVLDQESRPVTVYSVQVGSQGLPTGQGGDDIRYRYAYYDGSSWQDHPLAYAGTRLYSGEDDYSGLLAIDPENPSVVFFSTNADPMTGDPLTSAADGQRHYEIFRAATEDGGATFSMTPVTQDSSVDNLRPILPPRGPNGERVLLWLRGTYTSYTDFAQEVVAVFYED